jgi:hypothetical protein
MENWHLDGKSDYRTCGFEAIALVRLARLSGVGFACWYIAQRMAAMTFLKFPEPVSFATL